MAKKITEEQTQAILQAVYQTNISAQTFDSLKKLFTELPEVIEEEAKKK